MPSITSVGCTPAWSAGGEDEQLDARSGLAGHERHVDLVDARLEAAAADHRPDRAGLGVERDDRRASNRLCVLRQHLRASLLGERLQVGIERRVDLQTAAVQQVGALLLVAEERSPGSAGTP